MKQSVISLAVVSAFATLSWIPMTSHAATITAPDSAMQQLSAKPFAVIAERDRDRDDDDHCPRRRRHCDDDDRDD